MLHLSTFSNSNVDLPEPGDVSLEDIVTVVERDEAMWAEYCEERSYTMWSLLQILDTNVDARVVSRAVGGDSLGSQLKYMKRLADFFEKNCVVKFRDSKTSRNMDQTLTTELAKMMVSRWRVNMNKAENEHKLWCQRGKW